MVKVEGGTLIESMIALTIVAIVFSIGWLMIGILIDSDHSYLRQRSMIILDQKMEETIANEVFIEEQFEFDQFLITKKLEAHPILKNFFELSLEAIDNNGRVVGQRKRLIYAN